MRFKGYPVDVLPQAKETLVACKRIDPKLRAGTLTQEEFAQQIDQAEAVQAELQDLELQISALRNKRDERLARIWDSTKRTRANVKGTYGDDSNEYELVGGTRLSDRKRPVRKQPKKDSDTITE